MSNIMRMTIGLVFFLIFMPVVLWLTIAAMADASDYLALMRSGFLLLGLGLGIGWGLLKNSPRLVLFGLGLALVGYLTFTGVVGSILGERGQGFSLNDPIPWHVRHGLSHEIISGFPLGHVVALVLVLINIVMVHRRFQLARIAVSNALIFVAIYIVAAALGVY